MHKALEIEELLIITAILYHKVFHLKMLILEWAKHTVS